MICSGNHDLTGLDANGEQSALWLSEARANGIPTDGSSEFVGTTLVTICPWWDGPKGSRRTCCTFNCRCGPPASPMDMGLSLASARIIDFLDRST